MLRNSACQSGSDIKGLIAKANKETRRKPPYSLAAFAGGSTYVRSMVIHPSECSALLKREEASKDWCNFFREETKCLPQMGGIFLRRKPNSATKCEELPRMAKALSGQRPMPGSMRFAPMQRTPLVFPWIRRNMMERSH